MKKINTAICDDNNELLTNYKMYLDMTNEFLCVGVAQTAESCVELVKETKPDLLLLDIQIECDTDGIEIIPQIIHTSPDTKIIMLTSHTNEKYIFNSLVNGAEQFVVKKTNFVELFNEIYDIYSKLINNINILTPQQISILKTYGKTSRDSHKSLLYMLQQFVKLSPLEYEILKDIYANKKYSKIAKNRFVSESTIKTLAKRIVTKLEFSSMKECIDSLRK